ncbi:uncharacterized protein LOC131674001 [Phymastichus coffea]|uniref:uncharacterized protein LOC131674001 n=1 Tax=Phymastichus coffea TaxID=108790 RepID=UPI00273CC311|nr:uncharacterized protein LOC131674001 [Phymastichus coffea]
MKRVKYSARKKCTNSLTLESFLNKYNLKPSDLYILDETVIKCSTQSVQYFGKSIESNESQDKLITAVVSFLASGAYVPLLMIFPDIVKNKPLIHGAPPTAWALVNSCGQLQLDIFIRWLHKFIDLKKPIKSKPTLILVHGYHLYLKNLDVLEIMTENGVYMFCLPPNRSNKLQPSRYSFMDVLGTAYKNEVTNWTMNCAGQSVSVDEVFKFFGNAFRKVSTVLTANSSFASTGIWSCNRNLFKHEFI